LINTKRYGSFIILYWYLQDVIIKQYRCQYTLCISWYSTAGVGKRVHSTSLYHSRQCWNIYEPRWDRI